MSKSLGLLAFVLCSRVAIAGTDVGYELNTSALESATANQVVGNAVQIEDRTWAAPGVEQSVNNSDLVVHPRDESSSDTRIAIPRMHSFHCMTGNVAQLPQWINEIIWPLTRELWSDMEFEPYVPLPIKGFDRIPGPRKGIHGMILATQR